MAVLFIHGVNVRDREQNLHDAKVMSEHLLHRVFQPLAQEAVGLFKDFNLDPLQLKVPYWGGAGVQFCWDLETVPKLTLADTLGSEVVTEPSDTQVQALADILALSNGITPHAPGNAVKDPLLTAARTDFERFIEFALEPIISSEWKLVEDDFSDADSDDASSDRVGSSAIMEGLLITAAEELSQDEEFSAKLNSTITSDKQLLSELRFQFGARLERLAEEREAANQTAHVDALGGWGVSLKGAKDRLDEFFVRVAQSPSRIPSVLGLKLARESLTAVITRFTGDVFEYVNRRGNSSAPGEIVKIVLDSIESAKQLRPKEPLFVVTHSMGGNIFYDILTHYRPQLEVYCWLSVGGQVGLFEEMKLFHESDRAVRKPSKVNQLKSRVKVWLNIYDPADGAAFQAEPVFECVKDIRFSTGVGDYRSHLDYFKRLRFYDTVLSELRSRLKH